MNRREALRAASILLGGAITMPTMASILGGCQVRDDNSDRIQFFSKHQNDVVDTVSELIIPETDTPGARSAGVSYFIDSIVGESFAPEDRDEFSNGLERLESRFTEMYGSSFLDASYGDKMKFLGEVDERAFSGRDRSSPEHIRFFRTLKELVLIGYYTSEIGASEELSIILVPGKYEGCIDYEEVGRAWAV